MLGYDYLSIPLDNNLLYNWAKQSYKEFKLGTAAGKISKKKKRKESFLAQMQKKKKKQFK